MAASAGADVAIIIVSVVLLFAAGAGAFLFKKFCWRRKEREHAKLTSRELDLDFDTTDIERVEGPKSVKGGHARGWSESSADSFQPLMKYNPYPYVSPPPFKREGTLSPPEDRHTLLPTADHQLSNLVSRPSFLTRPRTPPHPQRTTQRATQPRSRPGTDIRSALLTRLMSAHTEHISHSADESEEDSPKSVYSQASTGTLGYRALEGDVPVNRGEVPPDPPIPSQSLKQAFTMKASPLIPPPKPEVQTSHVGGWRHDPDANNTLDSNPFSSRTDLRDSTAYPLPSPTGLSMISPNSPHHRWFVDQSTNPLPSETMPSPNPTFTYPSHPSYRSRLAEAVSALVRPGSEAMVVRKVEASRDVPEYDVVHSHHIGECGTVGYQLPQNFRESGTAPQRSQTYVV